MDMRSDWIIQDTDIDNIFYTKEETIENVKENFDIRRFYSSEGYNIEINGVVERCLVQTSSNPLRELNDYRKIHCPITADVKRGYYVKYEDSFWIIDTNVANIDGAYLSTRMTRCQYILRWQNSNGTIIERFAYASDQTKYSNGETGNSTITVGENQYALLLPIDKETKFLKRGMRFAVDFDDSPEPDVYKLTNRKIVLSEGTILVTLSFDAFSADKDKQITLDSGKSVWICDYHSPALPEPTPPDETANLSALVSGSTSLKVGYKRKYIVKFIDGNGTEVTDYDFKWDVQADLPVVCNIDSQTIELAVNDEDCIGSSFLLRVIIEGKIVAEKEITIIEGF